MYSVFKLSFASLLVTLGLLTSMKAQAYTTADEAYMNAIISGNTRAAIDMLNNGQDPLADEVIEKVVTIPHVTYRNYFDENYSDVTVLGWAIASKNKELIAAIVTHYGFSSGIGKSVVTHYGVDPAQVAVYSIPIFWIGFLSNSHGIHKYFHLSAKDFAEKMDFDEIVPLLKDYDATGDSDCGDKNCH